MSRRERFDALVVLRALTRAHGPENVARIIDGDLRKQALADHLFETVAKAPPATPEQRAVVAAIFHTRTPRRTASKAGERVA